MAPNTLNYLSEFSIEDCIMFLISDLMARCNPVSAVRETRENCRLHDRSKDIYLVERRHKDMAICFYSTKRLSSNLSIVSRAGIVDV